MRGLMTVSEARKCLHERSTQQRHDTVNGSVSTQQAVSARGIMGEQHLLTGEDDSQLATRNILLPACQHGKPTILVWAIRLATGAPAPLPHNECLLQVHHPMSHHHHHQLHHHHHHLLPRCCYACVSEQQSYPQHTAPDHPQQQRPLLLLSHQTAAVATRGTRSRCCCCREVQGREEVLQQHETGLLGDISMLCVDKRSLHAMLSSHG